MGKTGTTERGIAARTALARGTDPFPRPNEQDRMMNSGVRHVVLVVQNQPRISQRRLSRLFRAGQEFPRAATPWPDL